MARRKNSEKIKEIEIKLKVNNEKLFRDKLRELNSKFLDKYEITDCYYTMNGETLEATESFLRIRTKKEKSELTFKSGRDTKGKVSERTEINVSIENPENMFRILEKLGFNLIRKNRTIREYFLIDNAELVIVNIIEPINLEFVEIEAKTKAKVEAVSKLFGKILEPIDSDYFAVLDRP